MSAAPQYNFPSDFMADEDKEVLVAISNMLATKSRFYRIDLPNGAYISNRPKESSVVIDGVHNALEQEKIRTGKKPSELEVVVHTKISGKRKKVGKLFGADIVIDPLCPQDKFKITQKA